jgi:hypothetical protein
MYLKTNDQLNVIYTIPGKIFREIHMQYSPAYGGNTNYIQGTFCWRHACIDCLLCLACLNKSNIQFFGPDRCVFFKLGIGFCVLIFHHKSEKSSPVIFCHRRCK